MAFNRNILAKRTGKMSASAIREILKAASLPEMISLAGGIPSPDSFPMEIIAKIQQSVLRTYGSTAFQYDLTEGIMPLREAVSVYLEKKQIRVTAKQVVITTGSQGVLDAAGKILISKNEKVAVEAPTYLGALQAFTPYEPKYIQLESDEEGVIPQTLEKALLNHPVKFIYLVPNFQNPTGRTISMDRRKQIAEIIKTHNALLIEDDPYGDLRYRGSRLTPIKALAPDNVVYVSTLSKVFAPGLRLGFCAAPEFIQDWLVLAKQGVDLHTSTLNQAMAAEYLSAGHLERHLPHIVGLYRPRLEAMLEALEHFFPPGFSWSKPEGGMFVWVTGPAGMDMEALYWKAIEKKVAYVPGTFFFAHKGDGKETMRLNFTMADPKTIKRAIEILSRLFEEELQDS